MPFVKEIGFFSGDTRYAKGLDWYLDHFLDAIEGQIIGEASPQYMMNPYVPKRIQKHLPNVKLVAVLRNPIDRAYSSYRMVSRRGGDSRGAGEAMLAISSFDPERPIDRLDYFGMGLYGAVLNHWLGYFPSEQTHIVFSEELSDCPEIVMVELLNFIGADSSILPDNIHHHYHRGGKSKSALVKWFLPILGKIEGVLPRRRRGWTFRLEQWNTLTCGEETLPQDIRDQMRMAYQADVRKLEALIARRVPWKDFQ